MAMKTTKSRSSQEFVSIKEVRDGVLILRDNSLRIVLMTSSLNFALKSSNEQEAIILQYQSFLNSLDFSVQFLIHSRNLNIEPYLETLREKEQQQTDELLKIQTREYIEFVKEFVTATNIVNKTFYVVIPYKPSVLVTKEGPIGSIFKFLKKLSKKQEKPEITPQERFEEQKLQLQQRVSTVIQGLSRSGIRIAPLNTEELIELLYGLYNPGELEKTKLPEYVQK
ncbi:hypothetical protein ACFL1O_00180 [Patescibacteria group bacterium]